MLDDADVVTRAKCGDRAAFEVLVAAHTAVARRTAVLLGAGDEADDMVQDALVKAYRRLGEYRGESSFRAWLLAIVANETRNLHRSRQRRSGVTLRAAALVPIAEDTPDLTADTSVAAVDREELLAAVRELSASDREVIAYRYLLDMSEAATAQALDWPRGTVKSRTSRALAKLRTRLGAAVAVLVAVALVVAVPPARRAVAHAVEGILRFAGIEVRVAAPSVPPPSPSPLPSAQAVTVDVAQRLARFPIGVPAAWGVPDQVVVSDPDRDGAPRVVSLIYRGGAVRIDEFDGALDGGFLKVAQDVRRVEINGEPGLWLPDPHGLVYVDRHGAHRVETTRLAGPTLIWQNADVTYRIEGLATLAEAIAVATSVR